MSQFKLFQGQHLKQELRINPRLYQAMELLYMPLLDLQQHLKTELAENPFLEMSEADVVQELELKEEEPETGKDENEIDWEEILLDGFDAGGRKQEYEHKEYVPPTAVIGNRVGHRRGVGSAAAEHADFFRIEHQHVGRAGHV